MSKPNDSTKYKYKDLKVYASTEWLADGQKKYRQVYTRAELAHVYAELSFYNKLFDEEAWEIQIHLRAFRKKDDGQEEQICEIEVSKDITPDLNIVYIREGWGSKNVGTFWKEGAYTWRAYLDGKEVGSARFYVYDVPPVTPGENPFLNIESIRLFEANGKGRHSVNRTYMTGFQSAETRFIYVEFTALNRMQQDWMCEVTFNFYNDARQLKGRNIELAQVQAGQQSIIITTGWGSDFKGTWFEDNYTVEVVFMENLLAVVPFKVGDTFIEGLVQPLQEGEGYFFQNNGQVRQDQEDKQTLEEVLAELESLIGLEEIKQRVREYAQYLNFLRLRQEKGIEEEQQIRLHAVFTGNPGTGKTTVARMLGRIYHKLGLLSRGHVHEVDRADLIGEYIGQTAPKVKEAIKNARGGILFIDEAYALARTLEDAKDYGREVIELLVKEMSDGQGDLAVVVAGYPREMDTFLHSNPGLKSRFTLYFDFPDYLPQELEQIADYAARKRAVTLTGGAQSYLAQKLVEAYRKRDRSFGNARYVYSLIDEAKMNLGLRIMRSEQLESLSDDAFSTLTEEDISEIFEGKTRKKARIPIDESLLHECLEELNRMTGLHSVKNEVHELVKLVRFYRETGKDVLNRFSLHTVFTGNPGTGKTTLARLLGRIYKALGILERGDVVECDRHSLVAGYVGQTALKTAAIVDSARGSVLFIDEAYALSQGGPQDFGKEAIDTLLKRMEDLRGELIVIVAGYPDLMKAFLEANPGLRSRFDRKLEFYDYNPEELMQIARDMLDKEQLKIHPEAEAHVDAYFRYLYRTKNKFFGNARAVRKVVEKAIKNQHLRLASLEAGARTPEMIQTLLLEDVAEFTRGNDSLLEGGGHGYIGF